MSTNARAADASVGTGAPPSLAARLAQARVRLRPDLEVTRHLFRGEPQYVLSDPITFQNHRVSPQDYEILVRLDPGRTLGELFDELVRLGKLSIEDAEAYYAFVFSLHRLGFLSLPVSDESGLYRRYAARRAAGQRRWPLKLVALRVPLVNPDRSLARTLPRVAWLFSRTFFALWLALVAGAGWIAWERMDELTAPLASALAPANLPWIWVLLVVLKAWHELGHAYACKHFGGRVPEIGAYFILLTPCAYVDASAAWTFPRFWQRQVVNLAGMYFESIAAALAVFVWALTDPGLVHSLAYQTIFLASVVTIAFNLNPLMKFDGYYVLSDLLQIPNLASRASAWWAALGKRALGLPSPMREPAVLQVTFALYGFGAALFQLALAITLGALIASQLFIVGMAAGAAYLVYSLGGFAWRTARYLVLSPETRPVRGRAIGAAAVIGLGIPAALATLPWRQSLNVAAVVRAADSLVVHAASAGTIVGVHAQPGERIDGGTLLVSLSDEQADDVCATAAVRVELAEIRRFALLADSPAQAAEEAARLAAAQDALREALEDRAALRVASPREGRVLSVVGPRDMGRWLPEGAELARIGGEGWEVTFVLTEADFRAANPSAGAAIEFRAADNAGRTLRGTVTRIRPAGSRSIREPALTIPGGGEIAVDALTAEAAAHFFEVTASLDVSETARLRDGLTGRVRLAAASESLGMAAYRRVLRFLDQLRT